MTTRAAIVSQLHRTLEATEPLYRLPPVVLARAYAPGKWTLHQLLVHLADHETIVIDRLRRAAADQDPLLFGYDQDRWANGLAYAQRSIEIARDLYVAARRTVIDLLAVLPPEADARIAVHHLRGRQTLIELCNTGAHNAHHLEQARAAAEGRIWHPSGT